MGVGRTLRLTAGSPRSALPSIHLFSFLVLVSLFSILIAVPTAATSIGVNRGAIDYENVLRNGYAQEDVLVSTDSPDIITGTYEVEGELAPWIKIEPAENFTFNVDNPHPFRIIVQPPTDAQLRNYSGSVRVLTGEIARSDGGKIGTSTRAAFLIKIRAGLTGVQMLRCTAGGMALRQSEIGQPIDFISSVHNTGNVRLRPDFTVVIYDQYQTKLLKNITFTVDQELLPTTTGDALYQLMNDLPAGQYWARINAITCGDEEFMTFDVLDRGGIADKGTLVKVEAKPWAETGEIIPIAAIFRNDGPRTVSAKFKGTITTAEGGKLVKVIETDTYDVPPTQTARLESFFNPTEPGQYIIAGRVLYNNKLTFQKSAIVNVNGSTMVAARSWKSFLLPFLLLLILILLLLILIAKKRRRKDDRGSQRILRR